MNKVQEILTQEALKRIKEEIIEEVKGKPVSTDLLVKTSRRTLEKYFPNAFTLPHTYDIEFSFNLSDTMRPIGFWLPCNRSLFILEQKPCKNT